MSSLSDTERVRRWAKQLQQLQRNPWWVWGSLVGGVLIATLLRWAIGGLVDGRIPFTTYYPAILLATLLGGFWWGTLASVLSAAVAWWVFMPPTFGFELDQAQLVSLITFILVCLLLVGTVTALNAAVDLLLVESNFRREAQIALGQLASVAETSEDAIITKDLDGIITSWNKGAERIFGYEADEMIGKPINLLIPADRPDEEPSILARLRKGQRIEHYETVRRRKDGELIDISLSVSPLVDSTGKIVGASKIARDITGRRQAQEVQSLLLGEMRHRINNLFAITNSLVTLSARTAKTPLEMETAIKERLAALARAQQLTRRGLIQQEIGCSDQPTLKGLIQAIFAPYVAVGSNSPERIVVSGCDQEINDSAVTSVALLLHELATNAAKYGALSASTGVVHIDCSSKEDWLVMSWEERGGPPINGSPNREGFGGTLVRKIVASQFRGRFSNEWNSSGLTIRIEIPLAHLNPVKDEPSRIDAAQMA
jgi:PAS domain S-box-containing protein